MLIWRLLLGTLIVAALVGLCWLDYNADRPGIYLLPLTLVVSVLGAGELVAIFRERAVAERPLAWTIYAGVIVTVLAAGAPELLPTGWTQVAAIGQLGWLAIGLALGLFIAFIGELRRFESPGHATTTLALAVFAILYLGGLIGFMVQLRFLGGNERGMLALISLIATVKVSDIGQYTVGRLAGRMKLAPRVSPGKTWEGVIGGGAFAIFAAWLVFSYLPRNLTGAESSPSASSTIGSFLILVGFAIAVAAAGIIGDLAESLLKRDADVKDSSTWLPGFGGVLDLLDSLLGAAPVAYLFWAMGWVGR